MIGALLGDMIGAPYEFDRGAKSDEELIAAFVANDPELEKEIRLLCEDMRDTSKNLIQEKFKLL